MPSDLKPAEASDGLPYEIIEVHGSNRLRAGFLYRYVWAED